MSVALQRLWGRFLLLAATAILLLVNESPHFLLPSVSAYHADGSVPSQTDLLGSDRAFVNISIPDKEVLAYLEQTGKWPYCRSLISLNSSLCHVRPFEELLLIGVMSAPSHFEYRQIIRDTWGSIRTVHGMRIEVRFFIGQVVDDDVQAKLEAESVEFWDIIQQEFMDSYRNLTTKTMSYIQWALQNCSGAKSVLKVDDDVFVYTRKIVPFLQAQPQQRLDGFICGANVTAPGGGKVIRKHSSKWYVSEDLWSEPYFPHYCQGFGYFVPVKHLGRLLMASTQQAEIPIEDAYFTGILSARASVIVNGPTHLTMNRTPVVRRRAWQITRNKKTLSRMATYGYMIRAVVNYPNLLFVAHLEQRMYMEMVWCVTESIISTRNEIALEVLYEGGNLILNGGTSLREKSPQNSTPNSLGIFQT